MTSKYDYTEKFLLAANIKPNEDLLEQKSIEWWHNIRSKDSGGYRLTEKGIDFIKDDAKLKTYTVKFPGKFTITPQILVWLDQFLDSPYYITKKDITVLTERSAFELYLFSGDVKKFGYNRALRQRMSQD
jgi:regulatory protein YycI of two-component signal transduction system YycFG